MFRRWKWTTGTFLRALTKHRHQHRVRSAHKKFVAYAYEEAIACPEAQHLISGRGWANFMELKGWQLTTTTLREELKALVAEPCFGQYRPDSTSTENSIESLTFFENAMKARAPRWMSLFSGACGVNEAQITVGRKIVLLSILANLLAPKNSTNFGTILGLYLYQGGARRRVIQTLNRCGLSRSYQTLQRCMAQLSESGERQVREVGRTPAAIVTYDNFEFAEGKRGERIGDTRQFRSITTALVFTGQLIPPHGLRRDMWRPRIPLQIADIVLKLNRDDVGDQVCPELNNRYSN